MHTRKLRIGYFDLFHGGFHEDYSISPKKYGGGPIFARWAKEYWKDRYEFIIFAPKKCWEHIDELKENKSCFVELPENICKLILQGVNIINFIPNIDYFDIIMHGHTNVFINNFGCKCVQVHWSGLGRATEGSQFIPYTFAYGNEEWELRPIHQNQKIVRVKIGKTVPKEFVEHQKEDFIFQCSRHDESLDSIDIVKNCNKYKIKGYFAGVVNSQYPLLDFIDNQNTFWLGEISEELKLMYSKLAKLATFITPFGCVFNQSVIECLGLGTPILYKKIFKTNDWTWKDWLGGQLLTNGYNGVCYNGNNFLECWEKAKNIDQKNCWLTAKNYSIEEMMRTFTDGIEYVVKDLNIKL